MRLDSQIYHFRMKILHKKFFSVSHVHVFRNFKNSWNQIKSVPKNQVDDAKKNHFLRFHKKNYEFINDFIIANNSRLSQVPVIGTILQRAHSWQVFQVYIWLGKRLNLLKCQLQCVRLLHINIFAYLMTTQNSKTTILPKKFTPSTWSLFNLLLLESFNIWFSPRCLHLRI